MTLLSGSFNKLHLSHWTKQNSTKNCINLLLEAERIESHTTLCKH